VLLLALYYDTILTNGGRKMNINLSERANARRDYLQKEIIERHIKLDLQILETLSIKLNCSIATLKRDFQNLINMENRFNYNCPDKLKIFIHERDKYICQYCGISLDGITIPKVVEHVIPVVLGGVTEPYNLVTSCNACNVKKGQSVWIPANLNEITQNKIEWREQIQSLSKSKPERKFINKSQIFEDKTITCGWCGIRFKTDSATLSRLKQGKASYSYHNEECRRNGLSSFAFEQVYFSRKDK
jgi:hypothetical protein